MTEMRYELAIERIENIKGENTVSEKYRDYFRTLADFALLVDKLKEKIENGEYYKFSIEELECWNTHLYDDVLGEHYKTSYANPAFATEKFGIEYGRLLSFLYTELRGVIPYAFEKKTEYLDILFELFIEVYNQFEEENEPEYEHVRQTIYWYASDYCDVFLADRIKEQIDVEYVFQELDDLPEGFEKPADRTKPWGTGQAVLACKGLVKEPFAVINADDYYGKDPFVKLHDYLVQEHDVDEVMPISMAGFVLGNTLSDNGGVTRGVCVVDENGNLTGVNETKNIVKTAEGAGVEKEDGTVDPIDKNSLVSMNMWGLTPEFLDVLEEGFEEFFEKEVPGNPQKAEYLIPIFIGELLEQGKMSVKVLKTNDTWYGMTYHEDVAAVKDSFKKMLADGVYKADLFSDL